MSYSLNELINKLDNIINFKASQLEDLTSIKNVPSNIKTSYGNNSLDYSKDLSLEAIKDSILYWHNIIISPNSYCPTYYYRKGEDGKLIHPLADDLKDMTIDNYNTIIERLPSYKGLSPYGSCLCNTDDSTGLSTCKNNTTSNPAHCTCNIDENTLSKYTESAMCSSDTSKYKFTQYNETDRQYGPFIEYAKLKYNFDYSTCSTKSSKSCICDLVEKETCRCNTVEYNHPEDYKYTGSPSISETLDCVGYSKSTYLSSSNNSDQYNYFKNIKCSSNMNATSISSADSNIGKYNIGSVIIGNNNICVCYSFNNKAITYSRKNNEYYESNSLYVPNDEYKDLPILCLCNSKNDAILDDDSTSFTCGCHVNKDGIYSSNISCSTEAIINCPFHSENFCTCENVLECDTYAAGGCTSHKDLYCDSHTCSCNGETLEDECSSHSASICTSENTCNSHSDTKPCESNCSSHSSTCTSNCSADDGCPSNCSSHNTTCPSNCSTNDDSCPSNCSTNDDSCPSNCSTHNSTCSSNCGTVTNKCTSNCSAHSTTCTSNGCTTVGNYREPCSSNCASNVDLCICNSDWDQVGYVACNCDYDTYLDCGCTCNGEDICPSNSCDCYNGGTCIGHVENNTCTGYYSCTCNTRTDSSCTCNEVCSCNSDKCSCHEHQEYNTGYCTCKSGHSNCTCNLHQSTCSCYNNNTTCSCNTRDGTCTCVSQKTCSCNYQTSCSCNTNKACECHSHDSSCECNTFSPTVGCSCNNVCTCEVVDLCNCNTQKYNCPSNSSCSLVNPPCTCNNEKITCPCNTQTDCTCDNNYYGCKCNSLHNDCSCNVVYPCPCHVFTLNCTTDYSDSCQCETVIIADEFINNGEQFNCKCENVQINESKYKNEDASCSTKDYKTNPSYYKGEYVCSAVTNTCSSNSDGDCNCNNRSYMFGSCTSDTTSSFCTSYSTNCTTNYGSSCTIHEEGTCPSNTSCTSDSTTCTTNLCAKNSVTCLRDSVSSATNLFSDDEEVSAATSNEEDCTNHSYSETLCNCELYTTSIPSSENYKSYTIGGLCDCYAAVYTNCKCHSEESFTKNNDPRKITTGCGTHYQDYLFKFE